MVFKTVINKHGGQAAFARLTGIAPTTVADHYHGRTDTAAIRLLYVLLHMAGEGTIKAAARRAAANNGALTGPGNCLAYNSGAFSALVE